MVVVIVLWVVICVVWSCLFVLFLRIIVFLDVFWCKLRFIFIDVIRLVVILLWLEDFLLVFCGVVFLLEDFFFFEEDGFLRFEWFIKGYLRLDIFRG